MTAWLVNFFTKSINVLLLKRQTESVMAMLQKIKQGDKQFKQTKEEELKKTKEEIEK